MIRRILLLVISVVSLALAFVYMFTGTLTDYSWIWLCLLALVSLVSCAAAGYIKDEFKEISSSLAVRYYETRKVGKYYVRFKAGHYTALKISGENREVENFKNRKECFAWLRS